MATLVAASSTVCIIVAIVVGGLLLLILIAMYNKLVRLRNRTENAWAQVDVQLRKRYDLIPNLVETVKGYASHEQKTLEPGSPLFPYTTLFRSPSSRTQRAM